MNRPANRFLLKPISLAVAASILFPTTIANAQSNEEEVIEEVVATGTRLKVFAKILLVAGATKIRSAHLANSI